MPTLDYSYSNTPPTAVPMASEVPSNTAPTAVALASMAGTNSQPAAIALPSQTPNNSAPANVTLSGLTPDNTPPTAVTIPSMAQTGAQPAAIAFGSETPDNTPPVAVPLAAQTPNNTPPTAVPVASMTPSNAAPAAIPLASTAGTDDTPRPIGYVPPLAPLIDDNVNTPILQIEGELALNAVYGQTRTANAMAIQRVQFSLQDPPTGGPATIALVDESGTPYGVSVTIADGQTFAEYVPGAPVPLLAGSNVRAKATAVGPTNPGGFGNVTLFLQLAS